MFLHPRNPTSSLQRIALAFLATAFLLVPVSTAMASQDEYSSHALYGEFLGQSGMFGGGYDFRPVKEVSVRFGAGVVLLPWDNKLFVLPGLSASVTGLFGSAGHYLEYGLGYMHFIPDNDSRFITPQVGHRYQPDAGGVYLRSTVMLLIRAHELDSSEGPDAFLFAGFSIGRAF